MKMCKRVPFITTSEWEKIPFTFDAGTMASILGCGKRFVQDHAKALGGKKFGGRWIFTKPKTAELLGIA